MQPISFKESNKTLGKPQGWTDEQCSPLPVFSDGKQCISLWKPTIKERLSILFFGRVWLWVWTGATQPPVSIEGKKKVFKEVSDGKNINRVD